MERNSLNSFENLCKIFEMRIKLDREKNVKTSIDVFDNYEKYSRKIDSIYNGEFQKELKPLISPAVTLEKEKDRLRRLIKLLEDRLDKRVDLEDRFYETTGKYISGLQMIVSEEELEDKKMRLSIISKYLDTTEEIENVNESINKLKDSLLEEENKRDEYENKNRIMEDELYTSFMNVINSDEYYKRINQDEISSELDKIRSSVSETKETLDITRESIGSLINTGMEDDYASYIEEAEKNYYNYKNKELILKIYKLVIDFEDDFKLICAKREKISELLEEKRELSEGLEIKVDNELLTFENVMMLQNNTLDNEGEVFDNIANYTSRIKFKEERLDELYEANNSVEILSILREYGIIDTYNSEEVTSELELLEDVSTGGIEFEVPSLDVEDISFEQEETVIQEVYDPYRIVEIIDYPKTLNVGLAKLKGESVREKVNKKLNYKREDAFDSIELSLKKDDEQVETGIVAPLAQSNVEEVTEMFPVDFEKESNTGSEMAPVWELPTDIIPKSIESNNDDVSSLPVWEAIEPKFEESKIEGEVNEIEKVDITSDSDINSNLFWMPVSEFKDETNSFPDLKIPINNNSNKNNEFAFPSINS